MVKPELPTAYDLVVLERDEPAFAHALARAGQVDDGTLFWTERADRLELALVLEPEAELARTLQAYYAFQVAAGDALGAYTEAAFPLALVWPQRITFDSFLLARTLVAWPPGCPADAVPPWIVFGLEAEVSDEEETAERVDVITLRAAGALDVPVPRFVEAVARHFLFWLGRLESYGFAAVRAAWNERCAERGHNRRLRLGRLEVAGTVAGLDEEGRFVVGGRPVSLLEVPAKTLAEGRR